jgi:hypothetical protein
MIDGHWMPGSDEEWKLMEDLHVVTREAHNAGVPKPRIASALGFMAAAAIDSFARQDPEMFEEGASPDRDRDRNCDPDDSALAAALDRDAHERGEGGEQRPLCPACGEPAESARSGMGLREASVEPCGHVVTEKHFDGDRERFAAWFDAVESDSMDGDRGSTEGDGAGDSSAGAPADG